MSIAKRFLKILFLLSPLLSCSVDTRVEEESFPFHSQDENDEEDSTTTSGKLETSSTSTDTSESSIGEYKFDVGSENPTSCRKIDFLFVIDNSGSMSDNQENLISNYQGFIDNIVGLTGYDDFHIGVITTDAYQYNGLNCSVMGGLVVKTGGSNSSASIDGILSCGPWNEGNFMTKNEIDQIDGFSCAAKVGTDGSPSETPIDAFIANLGPFLGSENQCNNGFHRDDAKLIVVFITDEDDSSNVSIFNAIQQTEFFKGKLENIAMIGLVPFPESECSSSFGTKMKDFILSFPYSVIGDICDEDYSVFLEEAIDTIDQVCRPVG